MGLLIETEKYTFLTQYFNSSLCFNRDMEELNEVCLFILVLY